MNKPVADMHLKAAIRKIARPLKDAVYLYRDGVILAEYDLIYALLTEASNAPEAEIRVALSCADAQLVRLAPTIYPKYIQPAVEKLGLADVSSFAAALDAAGR
jgi:hypothetical protein